MAKVKISDELYKKLKKQAEESDFDSIEEYLEYVLKELVDDDDETYSEEEEEKVKERLRALGYL